MLIIRSEENIIKEIFSGLLKHACLFRINKGVIKLAKTRAGGLITKKRIIPITKNPLSLKLIFHWRPLFFSINSLNNLIVFGDLDKNIKAM